MLTLRSSGSLSPLRLISSFFLALLLVAPAFADSHARIVRLSYVDGDVQLDKGDTHGFNPAYMNMPVLYQSKLWARDGQAEVEFEDGSSIRLTPDTIVSFTDLSLDADGRRNTAVELTQGTAYFDIRHRDGDSFQLQLGRERVALTKAAHFRVDSDKHVSYIAVFSGEVQVMSGSSPEVAVKKGETIRLDGEDADRYDLAKGIDVENYDDWDNERAKGHDQEVATASVWGNSNGISYGSSELNSYGSYFLVPGYGYMWRPAGASLGWDPFADGYWVQYPGFGYTFVSGYPWGLAPYRYGSWQFVNGHGWCWAPGSWNNWHTVAPFRNPPPRWRPPTPPHTGPGVVIVRNGVTTPVPEHRVVVDNDSIRRNWAHASKLTTASGQVIQQGQPIPATPAQGFVAGTPAAAPTAAVPVVRPVTTVVGEVHRGDDGRNEHRGMQLNETKQSAPPATLTRSATVPNALSVSATHTAPRTESHISSPSRMSSPSMSSVGGTRMSSPPMSSGGAHMSSPSSAGSAGGGHSSGGSSHR